MSLDTGVPGSPTLVREMGEWLATSLRSAATEASDGAQMLRDHSAAHWHSLSGDHYRSTLGLLREASEEVVSFVADTAEKHLSYAGQLERLENRCADHRDAADDAGIPRTGRVIHEPVSTMTTAPADPFSPEWQEWSAHTDRVALYDEMSRDVGARRAELVAWVEENLVDFLAGRAPSAASRLLEQISVENEDLAMLYLDGQEAHWEIRINEIGAQAAQMQAAAEQSLADLESENPQVRAAAEEVRTRYLVHGGPRLQGWVDGATDVIRAVPVVGAGIDVILTATGIAQGDDVGATAVEVIAGAAVLAIGGAALVAVGAPIVVSVGVPAVAAIAVGGLGAWIYEEAVPQNVREDIDAGFRDFVADGWDFFVETQEEAAAPYTGY